MRKVLYRFAIRSELFFLSRCTLNSKHIHDGSPLFDVMKKQRDISKMMELEWNAKKDAAGVHVERLSLSLLGWARNQRLERP